MEDKKVILVTDSNLDIIVNSLYEKIIQEEKLKEEKEFLSQEETEKMLHKSSTTLWRYVQKGYLEAPQKRFGKNYYKTKQVMKLL